MGLIFLDDDYATHNVPGVSSVGASFLQRGCVFCTSSKELAKGCGRERKNSSKFSFIDKKKNQNQTLNVKSKRILYFRVPVQRYSFLNIFPPLLLTRNEIGRS